MSDNENQEVVLQSTLAKLESLKFGANELIEVTKEAISIPNINDKTILRNFLELCTGIIEKVCVDLSSDEAT